MYLGKYRRWKANWIWAPEARCPNTHVLFCRDIALNALPNRCTLFLSVETFGRVYLNGQDLFRSSSLSYPGQQHYEEVDLLPFLKVGTNQLSVLAWYTGMGTTATMLKDPGVLCEVELQDGAGITSIGSDSTWRCLKLDGWSGPRRSPLFNLDMVELLDYRKLPAGFPHPSESAGLAEPEVHRWPGVRMGVVEPRPFPRVELMGDAPLQLMHAAIVRDQSDTSDIPAMAVSVEDFGSSINVSGAAPFTLAPPPSGHAVTLVYSLGGYDKGYPHLVLDAPAGTIIDVSWCENLTNGHFDARPKHPWVTDRYTLREGVNVVSPEEWKAGRYLQFTFRRFDRPLQVRELKFVREHYPLKRRVLFRSSDERLNRIVEIGLKSAEMCMHDRIMDCPWRERRQWIGDVQRIGLVNYHAFDDSKLLRGVLRQHARLQDPSGRMWVCIPLMEEYPVQSMEWVRAILEYEHYTGDPTLREELADNVEWLHRWFLRCRDDAGLFFNPHPPVMNWMDNPLTVYLKHQFETAYLASNLRYLLFLDDVAEVLRHDEHLVPKIRAEREALAARIPGAFTESATGLLREMSNADLPLIFSELSAALLVRARVPNFSGAAYLDRFTAYDRPTIPTSPFGKHETFETLGHLGREADILQEIFTHWGPMVDAGSDTAWEWFENRGSVCHGWSGIPIVALMRHILHADPRHPGLTRREKVHGIEWMECEVS